MLAVAYGALLGLIIGSFLNVLILRWGIEGLGGRSKCPRCGVLIAWYDNIPVISWLLLRGRCRSCKAAISIQYPLVEALTGVLFALIAYAAAPYLTAHLAASLPLLAIELAIAAMLIAIAAYDLRNMLIPDVWAYCFIALAFVSQLIVMHLPGVSWPLLVLAGPVAALPLLILWAISRGRWMGFGDVELGLGMGWLLGPLFGVFAVFLAFVIGAVVCVPLVYLGRLTHKHSSSATPSGLTMKSEIPFGPFLVASCTIVWLSILYGFDPLALVGLSP